MKATTTTTINFTNLVQDTPNKIINTIHNNKNIKNRNDDDKDKNDYNNYNDINTNGNGDRNEIIKFNNMKNLSDTKVNNDYIPTNNTTIIKDNNSTIDIHKSKSSMTRLEIIQQQKQPYIPSFKSRCEFWPGCTNNRCKYYHPFMNCRNGKSCSFGKKCIFLHPDDCFDYQQLKKKQRKIKGSQKNQEKQQHSAIIKEKDQQQHSDNSNSNNKSIYKKKKKQAKKKELHGNLQV
ncbi:unnamed protein product [Cunninghamella blakesleeana]